MNKEEARASVMGAISMALKGPILQQGFELICKNLTELEKENAELKADNDARKFAMAMSEKVERQLREENAELKKKVENLQKYLDTRNCYRECAETWLKLTKAKELLNEFMRIGKASDEDFEHDYSELIGKAEQFIREVEK